LVVRVILMAPETGGNIGAVARSMKNFGLSDLWIVKPKTPINSDARAFAMKGLAILSAAKIVKKLDRALDGVDLVVGTSSVTATSRSNLSRVSIPPSELAEKIRRTRGVVAIIFGRESSGLSNQELEACDLMVRIPASRAYNVLNLGTAASIVFYELFLQKANPRSLDLASKEATRRLLLQFEHMVKSCTIPPHRHDLSIRAFRNIISRAFITKREASLLIGVFRKSNSKLT